MAKRENYVVGVLTAYENRTEIKYVTSLETDTKIAHWGLGKEAMIFSKDYAKDLARCLCINGYPAIPMIKADYLELKNPSEEIELLPLEIYREDYTEGQFNEILSSLNLNDDEVGEAFMVRAVVDKSTLKK